MEICKHCGAGEKEPCGEAKFISAMDSTTSTDGTGIPLRDLLVNPEEIGCIHKEELKKAQDEYAKRIIPERRTKRPCGPTFCTVQETGICMLTGYLKISPEAEITEAQINDCQKREELKVTIAKLREKH